MINCKKAAEQFATYLDRELSTQEIRALEAHIKKCKDCFGHLEFDRMMRRIIKNKYLKEKMSKSLMKQLSKLYI